MSNVFTIGVVGYCPPSVYDRDEAERLLREAFEEALRVAPSLCTIKLAGGWSDVGIHGMAYHIGKYEFGWYTIGYATFPLAINPSMLTQLRYDAARDLQMVIRLTSTPNLLVVLPAVPVKSVQELIDHARKFPRKLLYSSGGSGTSLHLGMELLMSMTGAQLVHVPYKGVDQATMAVVSGEAQVMIHNIAPILPHVRAGRVRGLAVTTLKRVPSVPDLPTIAESGVPGYEIAPWGGILAPAGIPKAVLQRLNAEFNTALKSKVVQETYAAAGVEPQGGTPEQFTEHVRNETAKWGALIKRLGIKGA